MEHRFIESTSSPEVFFSALPADWQEGIVPYWLAYEHTAKIYILESEGAVLGGGIVFSTVSPDTQPCYFEEALRWFDQGYLYIGFLWFSEQHRGKQLGTKWLQHVFELLPEQSFWLAIDDYKLSSFYTRNGFELIKKIGSQESEEWILAMHAQAKTKELMIQGQLAQTA
ncbi:gcn5-related n-acetyltransferase [Flammeovirgaceae bacterium 311]|nr:gcn5-related n-acetyltransferase [Flammeovirgaceae bacterium 311]